LTAGVHDATAVEAATETEGNGVPIVDADDDASTPTIVVTQLSDHVVGTTGELEDHQVVAEASIGPGNRCRSRLSGGVDDEDVYFGSAGNGVGHGAQ
jgi:hypothetical protein